MKANVLKITSVLLLLLIAVGGISVSASKTRSDAVHTFEPRDYYKTDLTLNEGREYEVPKGGILRIEEGATLWVDGELRVYGKLKNYGNIVVREKNIDPARKEVGEQENYGHISVVGKLENYGTIKIDSASIHNSMSGEIINKGKIILENENPDLIAFRNIGRKTEVASQGGTIINDKNGVITVANKEGIGLINQEGAKFENKGRIEIKRGSTARGKITGNSVEWID